MKINGGPSAMALQHMAARAQEVRKTPSAPESPIPSETSSTGNNVSGSGENLPATTGTEQSSLQSDHTTGLDRAIENLQQNAIKSPEAKGLQQALEMLQSNQERAGAVDVQA